MFCPSRRQPPIKRYSVLRLPSAVSSESTSPARALLRYTPQRSSQVNFKIGRSGGRKGEKGESGRRSRRERKGRREGEMGGREGGRKGYRRREREGRRKGYGEREGGIWREEEMVGAKSEREFM